MNFEIALSLSRLPMDLFSPVIGQLGLFLSRYAYKSKCSNVGGNGNASLDSDEIFNQYTS